MYERVENVLLIDAGNTRIKSAVIRNDELLVNPAIQHTKDSVFDICRALLESHQTTILYIASVLEATFQHSVKEYCASQNIQVFFVKSTAEAYAFRSAYQVPETLGVDRFVAMLGALDLNTSSDVLIVIDAGTALTIDILMQNGKHLGGTISPGLHVMFSSLHKYTQLDQMFTNNKDLRAQRFYADNTEDAIILGTINSFIAGIEHTIQQAITKVSTNASIIVTGGDAELIANGLQFDCEIHTDLVLRGLQKVFTYEQRNNNK